MSILEVGTGYRFTVAGLESIRLDGVVERVVSDSYGHPIIVVLSDSTIIPWASIALAVPMQAASE